MPAADFICMVNTVSAVALCTNLISLVCFNIDRLLCTFCMATTVHSLYFFTVKNFANPYALTTSPWYVCLSLITGLFLTVVQERLRTYNGSIRCR